MLHVLTRVLFWSVTYLLVALLPLGVAILGGTREGRGFLIEFGVGLGLVGFAMMGIQFVTTGRFPWVARNFGTDAKLQFHRETGILAVVFVLAHPLVLFVAQPSYLDYLNPLSNLPRAVFLSGATVAMVLLVAFALWRVSLGISYEWWRLTHGLFALAIILVGTAHGLQVGHYISGIARQTLWLAAAGIPVGLLFYTRVVRPLRMSRLPWRVIAVRPVGEDVIGLTLEPEGHPGLAFRAGQYAWLTMGPTPFTLQQHPFSFASSDEHPGLVEFAIKETGDFTRTIRDFKPGTRAYLEGPYGGFTFDPTAKGAVFVVGGIGITPVLSILRSCRDRRDGRPLLLINANIQWETIAFREELDMLTTDLDLKIVHVLETPPDEWDGEAGRIDADFLKRHLSGMRGKDFQYFVCGPTAMLDVVDRALVDQGVPYWRLVSERFDLV